MSGKIFTYRPKISHPKFDNGPKKKQLKRELATHTIRPTKKANKRMKVNPTDLEKSQIKIRNILDKNKIKCIEDFQIKKSGFRIDFMFVLSNIKTVISIEDKHHTDPKKVKYYNDKEKYFISKGFKVYRILTEFVLFRKESDTLKDILNFLNVELKVKTGYDSNHHRHLLILIEQYRKENLAKPTKAETVFRKFLEHYKFKFKEQKGIIYGKSFYLLDFFLRDHNTVVEIDGGYHNTPKQQEYDRVRDEYLTNNRKYKVIRFTNDFVLNNDFITIFNKLNIHLQTSSTCQNH